MELLTLTAYTAAMVIGVMLLSVGLLANVLPVAGAGLLLTGAGVWAICGLVK